MKRAGRIAAILVLACAFVALASCASTTTGIGVTTVQDADRADKQLR